MEGWVVGWGGGRQYLHQTKYGRKTGCYSESVAAQNQDYVNTHALRKTV